MILHKRRKDRYFELVVYTLKSTLKLTLHLIFAYWATQSVLKYVDEPAITNIYYQYTSNYKLNTTRGYVDKGVYFPFITFCDIDPEYTNILNKACGLTTNEKKPYLDSIKQCLSSNSSIDLNELSKTMKYLR